MTTTQKLTIAQRIAALRLRRVEYNDDAQYQVLGYSMYVQLPKELTKHRERFTMRGSVLYTRSWPLPGKVPVVTEATNVSLKLEPGMRLTPELCTELVKAELTQATKHAPPGAVPPIAPVSRRATPGEIDAYRKAEEAMLKWCEAKVDAFLRLRERRAEARLKSVQRSVTVAHDALVKFRKQRDLPAL